MENMEARIKDMSILSGSDDDRSTTATHAFASGQSSHAHGSTNAISANTFYEGLPSDDDSDGELEHLEEELVSMMQETGTQEDVNIAMRNFRMHRRMRSQMKQGQEQANTATSVEQSGGRSGLESSYGMDALFARIMQNDVAKRKPNLAANLPPIPVMPDSTRAFCRERGIEVEADVALQIKQSHKVSTRKQFSDIEQQKDAEEGKARTGSDFDDLLRPGEALLMDRFAMDVTAASGNDALYTEFQRLTRTFVGKLLEERRGSD